MENLLLLASEKIRHQSAAKAVSLIFWETLNRLLN
jgi:hypothetical protein